MQFSPTKLLHGLLYTAPVMLLTLVACGGGGGSTPDAPLAIYASVGGDISSLSSVSTTGPVLQNNGGDDLDVDLSAASYVFSTQIDVTKSYNVTVLRHPSSPTQRCSIDNASGSMVVGGISNANLTCVTAYTIGGTFTGVAPGFGLVLQNNGVENLLVASGVPGFAFKTPLLNNDGYDVKVLVQPDGQTCNTTADTNPASGVVGTVDVDVTIDCSASAPGLPVDQFAYAANYGSDNVSGYKISSSDGTLSPVSGGDVAAGSKPYAVAVDPAGKFAYVVNSGSSPGSIMGYSITPVSGMLDPLVDVDGGTSGDQGSISTGTTPVALAINRSGNFAYVVNKLSNSVSAYSIDAATGKLAKMDANGAVAGTDIATGVTPVAISVHPGGGYAYVANAGASGSVGKISAYSIDDNGVLTAINASSSGAYIDTGITPSSITVSPDGKNVYVTNFYDNTVSVYRIETGGYLTLIATPGTGAISATSIAIHPGGAYAYVANADGNISVYTRSTTTGTLSGLVNVSSGGILPNSISIDRSGTYAYVANSGSTGTGGVTKYLITAGVLSAEASYVTGNKPFAVATSP